MSMPTSISDLEQHGTDYLHQLKVFKSFVTFLGEIEIPSLEVDAQDRPEVARLRYLGRRIEIWHEYVAESTTNGSSSWRVFIIPGHERPERPQFVTAIGVSEEPKDMWKVFEDGAELGLRSERAKVHILGQVLGNCATFVSLPEVARDD